MKHIRRELLTYRLYHKSIESRDTQARDEFGRGNHLEEYYDVLREVRRGEVYRPVARRKAKKLSPRAAGS